VNVTTTHQGAPYDAEKIVWEWPDVTARLIEELR
jgi:hypothetical protein